MKGEEVRIVGMIAVVGRKTTWFGQAEAGVKEQEAWIMTSPAHPSLVGPQFISNRLAVGFLLKPISA